MNKNSDITDERIDELRIKHKASLNQELSPETLESFREQFNQTENSGWGGSAIYNVISNSIQSVSGKLDSWVQKSKENYSKFVSKYQAEKAKSKSLLFHLFTLSKTRVYSILGREWKPSCLIASPTTLASLLISLVRAT